MTRHDSVTGLRACAGQYPLWILGGLGALLLVLAGCGQTSQHRAKAADEGRELSRYDIPTIGDRTTVGGLAPEDAARRSQRSSDHRLRPLATRTPLTAEEGASDVSDS